MRLERVPCPTKSGRNVRPFGPGALLPLASFNFQTRIQLLSPREPTIGKPALQSYIVILAVFNPHGMWMQLGRIAPRASERLWGLDECGAKIGAALGMILGCSGFARAETGADGFEAAVLRSDAVGDGVGVIGSVFTHREPAAIALIRFGDAAGFARAEILPRVVTRDGEESPGPAFEMRKKDGAG